MASPLRTGTMIALASATLLAAGCSKAKDASSGTTETKEPAKAAAPAPGATPAAAPAATPAAPEKVAKVHCGGVNECKGKSGCQTAKNACAGQNGCKGQGYIELTAEDCQAKGGQVLADK
jgi:hypothetical protein